MPKPRHYDIPNLRTIDDIIKNPSKYIYQRDEISNHFDLMFTELNGDHSVDVMVSISSISNSAKDVEVIYIYIYRIICQIAKMYN